MTKYFFNILFICFTSISFSQIHEIGFFVGGSNYVGDIGSTNYIRPNKFAGALIYKYNYNPRMAFRATYSYLPVSGNDADASNPFRLDRVKNQKGLSFTNTLHEGAVGIEFNFFEYNTSEHRTSFTPYILAEFAMFSYKVPERINSDRSVDLRNSISYAIPFGLGIKGRLMDNLNYAVEIKARYAVVDDIDFSKRLSSPTDPNINLNYGGRDNDWYMFSGVSLVYTFGRPACYTDAR